MSSCIACGDKLVVDSNWTETLQKKCTYKCNPCRAEYSRRHYKTNKARYKLKNKERYETNRKEILQKQRAYSINKRFGLTVEEYDELLERACEICGQDWDKVLDHNHETGEIRGVLCRQCNQALGLFLDDSNHLRRAAEYIDENN